MPRPQAALADPNIGLVDSKWVSDIHHNATHSGYIVHCTRPCKYDGIFAAGDQSLIQVAHALQVHNCWTGPHLQASGLAMTALAVVDDSEVARALLRDGKLQFIIDQRQFLQAYLPVMVAVTGGRLTDKLERVHLETLAFIGEDGVSEAVDPESLGAPPWTGLAKEAQLQHLELQQLKPSAGRGGVEGGGGDGGRGGGGEGGLGEGAFARGGVEADFDPKLVQPLTPWADICSDAHARLESSDAHARFDHCDSGVNGVNICGAFCVAESIYAHRRTIRCEQITDVAHFALLFNGNRVHRLDGEMYGKRTELLARVCTMSVNQVEDQEFVFDKTYHQGSWLSNTQILCAQDSLGIPFCPPISDVAIAEQAAHAAREAAERAEAERAQEAFRAEQAVMKQTKTVLIFVCIFLFSVLAVCTYVLLMRIRKERRAQAEHLALNHRRAHAAISSLRELQAPMVLMRFSDFRALGGLASHEEARQRSLLHVLDTHDDLCAFLSDHSTVFCSHQWLGFRHPDVNNVHFRSIVDACDALCEQEGLAPESLYVWLDYHSIQQRNTHVQSLFINSLPFYAASTRYFLVIAPDADHIDTGKRCDALTYQRRGWCRLECWARMAAGGLDNMFLCSTDAGVLSEMASVSGLSGQLGVLHSIALPGVRSPSAQQWSLRDVVQACAPAAPRPRACAKRERAGQWSACTHNVIVCLQVFGGDFSNPNDKEKLVDPVLGLWAVVVSGQERESAAKGMYDHVLDVGLSTVFPPKHFGGLVDLVNASFVDALGDSPLGGRAQATKVPASPADSSGTTSPVGTRRLASPSTKAAENRKELSRLSTDIHQQFRQLHKSRCTGVSVLSRVSSSSVGSEASSAEGAAQGRQRDHGRTPSVPSVLSTTSTVYTAMV